MPNPAVAVAAPFTPSTAETSEPEANAKDSFPFTVAVGVLTNFFGIFSGENAFKNCFFFDREKSSFEFDKAGT